MEAAIFGLLGVALGALLTIVREWWFQKRKERKDIDYLAVQVSCILDRFATQCSLVASDEGTWAPEPDGQEHHRVSVDRPTLNLESSKFEWKFLPTQLMHSILRFPFEVENAEIMVSQTFELVASPPEYWEGFEERQLQYATVGLRALALARQLREHAGLSETPSEVESSVESHLRDVLYDIGKARAAQEGIPILKA